MGSAQRSCTSSEATAVPADVSCTYGTGKCTDARHSACDTLCRTGHDQTRAEAHGKDASSEVPHLVQPPEVAKLREPGACALTAPLHPAGDGGAMGHVLPIHFLGSSHSSPRDHHPHVTGGPTQAESLRTRRSPEPGGAMLTLYNLQTVVTGV